VWVAHVVIPSPMPPKSVATVKRPFAAVNHGSGRFGTVDATSRELDTVLKVAPPPA
jgi:hypothetical protein